jgi:hypothetical protein
MSINGVEGTCNDGNFVAIDLPRITGMRINQYDIARLLRDVEYVINRAICFSTRLSLEEHAEKFDIIRVAIDQNPGWINIELLKDKEVLKEYRKRYRPPAIVLTMIIGMLAQKYKAVALYDGRKGKRGKSRIIVSSNQEKYPVDEWLD